VLISAAEAELIRKNNIKKTSSFFFKIDPYLFHRRWQKLQTRKCPCHQMEGRSAEKEKNFLS
jgi:hypothetical protein